MGCPGIWVEGRVLAFVGDAARTELEEQAGDGAASWAAVQPKCKRRFFWRVSSLEEPVYRIVVTTMRDVRVLVGGLPEEQMLSV